MPPVSRKVQDQVYDAVVDFWTENKYSPSIRDIAANTDHSTSTVKNALDHLSEKGLINYQPHDARTIVLTGATWTPPDGFLQGEFAPSPTGLQAVVEAIKSSWPKGKKSGYMGDISGLGADFPHSV